MRAISSNLGVTLTHRRHRLETHSQLDLRPRRLPRRRHMGNRQLLRPHPPDQPLPLARRPQHRTSPRPPLAHQRTLRPRLRRRYRIPRLLRPRPLLLQPRLRTLRRPRPQMGLLNHPSKPALNPFGQKTYLPAQTRAARSLGGASEVEEQTASIRAFSAGKSQALTCQVCMSGNRVATSPAGEQQQAGPLEGAFYIPH